MFKPGDLVTGKQLHFDLSLYRGYVGSRNFDAGREHARIKPKTLGIVIAILIDGERRDGMDVFVMFPGPVMGWTLAEDITASWHDEFDNV